MKGGGDLVIFDWVRGGTLERDRMFAVDVLCLVGEMECPLPKTADPVFESCVDDEARMTRGWCELEGAFVSECPPAGLLAIGIPDPVPATSEVDEPWSPCWGRALSSKLARTYSSLDIDLDEFDNGIGTGGGMPFA